MMQIVNENGYKIFWQGTIFNIRMERLNKGLSQFWGCFIIKKNLSSTIENK